MLTLTAPDGSAVRIDAVRIVRARRTISGERGGENKNAQTRVDWEEVQLVTEPIDEVAALVKADLPSFSCLTTSDGSKIWFDAMRAVGPLLSPPAKGRPARNRRSGLWGIGSLSPKRLQRFMT
jgi:hypothetical protein